MLLSELLEEYRLEMQVRKVAYSTYTNYSRYIIRFIELTNDMDIEKVTNKDVKQFVKTLQADNMKSKTINLATTSIRSLLNYAVEEEYIDKNPIHIKKMKEDDVKQITLLTEDELSRLIKYNNRAKLYTKYRDHCIIITFIDTGIRANELRNIKLEDIHEDYIDIRVTKNGKSRTAPISNTLKKAMLKLDRLREKYFTDINKVPDDYLFVSRTGKQIHRANINDVIIKACCDCGIERSKAYPHLLRHSFACLTMKNTQNIYLTSKLLGHTNTNVTELYLRGLNDEDILSMQNKFISDNLKGR